MAFQNYEQKWTKSIAIVIKRFPRTAKLSRGSKNTNKRRNSFLAVLIIHPWILWPLYGLKMDSQYPRKTNALFKKRKDKKLAINDTVQYYCINHFNRAEFYRCWSTIKTKLIPTTTTGTWSHSKANLVLFSSA